MIKYSLVLILICGAQASRGNKRATTSMAKKRPNRQDFENNDNTNLHDDTCEYNQERRRPKSYKHKKRRIFQNLRSQTVIKDVPYSMDRMIYHLPLSDKNKNRNSLDHLTFNQIKLERIKQERKNDVVQKRLRILKHNHDYIDNKLDFK